MNSFYFEHVSQDKMKSFEAEAAQQRLAREAQGQSKSGRLLPAFVALFVGRLEKANRRQGTSSVRPTLRTPYRA